MFLPHLLFESVSTLLCIYIGEAFHFGPDQRHSTHETTTNRKFEMRFSDDRAPRFRFNQVERNFHFPEFEIVCKVKNIVGCILNFSYILMKFY